MKGQRGRNLRPQLEGSCCDRTQNLDPSFLAASEKAHDGLPSSLSLTEGTIRPGCEAGDCKCAFRKLTCFVLRASWGCGPAQGAALCLPHNLVPGDFGGPTDVCSTGRDLHTLPLGHQALRSSNFCPKHTSGVHLIGLLSDSHLTLQTAPEKFLSVSNG